tara:strand:- start:190 stop:882 length:693 start_codon:yes stop_codon:yes gene_type:complete
MLLSTTLLIASALPGSTAFSLTEPAPTFEEQNLAQRAEAMANLEATLESEAKIRIAPAMFHDDTSPTEAASVPAFGSEGSMRWGVLGGWGVDVKGDSNNELGIGVTWEYFMVDGFAFAPELKLWGFFQDGGDAFGVGLDLLFQWHFIQRDTWSIYADGGVGLLGTSKNVPIGGSEFNFTPQAGIGATFDVGNNNRWIVGVRWHHISNAGLYSDNPGRDSVYVYTGITLPF